MKRYTVWIIILLLSLVFFSNDRPIEISDRALIHAVGIDVDDAGYTVTLQIFQSNSAGASDTQIDPSKSNTKIVSNTAKTFNEAMTLCENQLGNYLFMGHNQIIVLGHDTNFEDPEELLSYFIRNKDNFLGVDIVLSETTAYDLLNVRLPNGTVSIESFKEVIEMYGNKGDIVPSDMVHFLNECMKPDKSAVLPVVSVKNNTGSQTQGTQDQSQGDSGSDESQFQDATFNIKESAVISDGKLAGTLTNNEVMCLNLLTNKTKYAMITINFKGEALGLMLQKRNSKTKLKPADNKLVYDTELSVFALTESNIFTLQNKDEISKLVEKTLAEQCYAVFYKALKNYNADIMGLSRLIKHYCPQIYLDYKDDFDTLKSNTELNITVNCIAE